MYRRQRLGPCRGEYRPAEPSSAISLYPEEPPLVFTIGLQHTATFFGLIHMSSGQSDGWAERSTRTTTESLFIPLDMVRGLALQDSKCARDIVMLESVIDIVAVWFSSKRRSSWRNWSLHSICLSTARIVGSGRYTGDILFRLVILFSLTCAQAVRDLDCFSHVQVLRHTRVDSQSNFDSEG